MTVGMRKPRCACVAQTEAGAKAYIWMLGPTTEWRLWEHCCGGGCRGRRRLGAGAEAM